jgi:hypothetical protein
MSCEYSLQAVQTLYDQRPVCGYQMASVAGNHKTWIIFTKPSKLLLLCSSRKI